MSNQEKVMVYVDGFNLYFGIVSKYPNTKWLNIWQLAQNILKPHQSLIGVKYFTSLVSNNPQKEKRQRDFLSAIQTTPVQIIYGHYQSTPTSCKKCGHSWNDNEEKMTDVNIAVNMITDAIEDKYDTAILISGDSDLVPAINSIHKYFPQKRVVVLFPPDRHNISVKNSAKGSYILGRKKLVASQFPQVVTTSLGYQITKPKSW
ncbi:hypothetical protein MROS_1288 [Melioribacter roseus P3M-2]|uniref:NYN domain-containing protein n=1 Tax=Melioribacter roseus (strain DSM 23840 / JCM 17771 / VKM B-2668 / P3M-2) TaxID=1191523 RepID=I6Z5T4_MELRP|nr:MULTISPECIES: NYN domain-containing protein [Ignavibacteriales]AFN74525.1 hypothetical protein MROS_1288 [Melioribacter roseus P3M-2]BDQ03948.1 MAG: hypothetical protein KatS3mg037_2523 [Ignavibacterium sp.]